ncbi:MAG: hypothetical protein ABI894_06810 [Ilumatobacteraceae bacterium]
MTEMSSALKSVVESGKSAVESGASTLSDLVEEAKSRIEDLPVLARPRRRKTRRRFGSIVLLGLVALALMALVQKSRHHETADPVDQSSVRHR